MRARGRIYFNQIAPFLSPRRYIRTLPKKEPPRNTIYAKSAKRSAQPTPTNEVTQQDTNQKLNKLVQNAGLILYEFKSIFPLDFFPTIITIDTRKVNIIFKEFFYSNSIQSIPIDNIFDVTVESVPFFARLKFVDVGYRDNEIIIKHLWKKDAEKARDIVQGLIVANQQDIKIQDLTNKDEICKKIEELGKVHRS